MAGMPRYMHPDRLSVQVPFMVAQSPINPETSAVNDAGKLAHSVAQGFTVLQQQSVDIAIFPADIRIFPDFSIIGILWTFVRCPSKDVGKGCFIHIGPSV